MNEGQIIIDAVIQSNALDRAEGPNLFVWSPNADEQIEAALHELGYKLVPVEVFIP